MQKRTFFLSVVSTLLLFACGGGNEGGLPPGAGDGGTGGGPAYDASTATATLNGNIMFEGETPEMPPIQMAADPFCLSHAEGARSQEVLVTDESKLQNVLVYVRSGHEGPSYATPSQPVVVNQENCTYSPHTFTMMVNQDLTVRNSDETLHNIHGFSEVNPQFNVGQAIQGMESTTQFAQEEIFPLRCDVHRWMNAYVGVFEHPFHTTSGDTGTFSISLPPGTYEIVAWHERYGEQVATIEIAVGENDHDFTFVAESAAD